MPYLIHPTRLPRAMATSRHGANWNGKECFMPLPGSPRVTPPRTLSGWRSPPASQDCRNPLCRVRLGGAYSSPTRALRALLHTLVQINRRIGVTEMMLWVLEDNHDAQHAYQALGFEPTGERQFLRAFGQCERRLQLRISGTQDF